MNQAWQNKIVRYGVEAPDQLLANPANARLHPRRQQQALEAAISEVGWIAPVIVNETTGRVVDGHLRISAAISRSEPSVPVAYVRLTEAEERLALATFDPITDLAAYDREALESLLAEVSTTDAALISLLDDLAQENGLERESGAGGDDFDTTPAEGPTRSLPGDLWEMGSHLFLCGDATDPAVISRLLDGRTPDLCLTDPPYRVAYERSQGERGGSEAAHAPFVEGRQGVAVSLAFLSHLACDVCVMTFPVDRHFFELAHELLAARWEVRKELVWVKDRFSFWQGADYQQQHEPILVLARRGRPLNANVPAGQSTVLDFPRPQAHKDHPTEKPLEMWQALLTFHAPSGGRVFDPFAGSGTTMIAAERAGRRALLVEIEPQYGDVILRRWEAETGREAELVERLNTLNTCDEAENQDRDSMRSAAGD